MSKYVLIAIALLCGPLYAAPAVIDWPPPQRPQPESWAKERSWAGYPFVLYRWYDRQARRTPFFIEWGHANPPPHLDTLLRPDPFPLPPGADPHNL